MNTTNTNLYDMIKSKKSREKDTSTSTSSSSTNDINMKRILIPLQRSCGVSTNSKRDALRAYDAHVVMQSSHHLNTDDTKSQLNLPEEWEDTFTEG